MAKTAPPRAKRKKSNYATTGTTKSVKSPTPPYALPAPSLPSQWLNIDRCIIFSANFNSCFSEEPLEVSSLCFIRCEKSQALFLRKLPCFKRINRVCMDFYETWPNCSLFIKAPKSFRPFDNSNTSPFTPSCVAKIGKQSIRQVQNRFSQQPIGISKKPHTLL